MRLALYVSIACFVCVGSLSQARTVKKVKSHRTYVAQTVVKKAKSVRTLRMPTSVGNDPNRAVEVRGQSRTLSMMLVLKNGKENINFIKVRKDYNPEILATNF